MSKRCIYASVVLIAALIAFSMVASSQFAVSYEDEKGDVDRESIDIVLLGVEDGEHDITCFIEVAGGIEDNASVFYYFHMVNLTVVYSEGASLLKEGGSYQNWTCSANGSRLEFNISYARLNASGIDHLNFEIEAETHCHLNGTLLIDQAGKDFVPDDRSELDRLFQDVCGFGMAATMYCLAGILIFMGLWAAIAILVYRDAVRRNDPLPILWAILVFLFSFLGLALYLVGRRRMRRVPPGSADEAFDDFIKDDDDDFEDWPPKKPPI